MAGITKTVIRVAVIGGLLTAGAAVVAGPHRLAALGNQARSSVNKVIDASIDDPIAWRAQLHDLEEKYPKRIAEVRSHVAEIKEQMRQISRDQVISEKVVALAQDDYNDLRDLIAQAEDARTEYGSTRLVTIGFRETTFKVDEAYTKANAIADTVTVYSTRANDLSRDLTSLERDSGRLESLLAKLETEHAQFRAQIVQLDGQIDSIARKKKMVKLMSDRQRRIDELSRYEVASLDQFKAKLAKRGAELDARLDALTRDEAQSSYEDIARYEVESSSTLGTAPRLKNPITQPSRLHFDGSDVKSTDDAEKTVASRISIR
jgi:chromosome segregation ATPase